MEYSSAMTTTAVARARPRPYMAKTKTGCKTCKIRRVKCDEYKPHCRRCTTTGRTCDGYDPGFIPTRTSPPGRTSSTKPSSSIGGQDAINVVAKTHPFDVPSFLVPSLRLETEDERISLEFYVNHAGPALARGSNAAFWQRQVMQAAHQHVSIQHCIVALGAMYRRFFECKSAHIDSDVSNQHFQFALHQSNKAIQQLVKQKAGDYQTNVTDKLTVMTCCVLFGSMANLQGQQQAALDHLRSGIRMLRETKPQSYDDRNCHPVNIHSLRSIFTGLDIQARSSISWSDIQDWEPVVSSMRASEPADIDLSSPWAASELLCRLETLLNDTLAFNRGCVSRPFSDRDSIQREHNTLVSRFHLASNNLDTLHSTSSSGSPHPPIRGDLLLLLYQTHHWLQSSISPLKRHFSIPSSLSSTPYDPTAHFTTMMHHATHLLSQTPARTPIYSTAPGPLSALWLVATSAPTSCVALRKRAITLLLSHPRREGVFDGRLAGRIGQAAWRLEQRAVRRELGLPGCCDEDGEWGADADLLVPEHLRIVHMDIEYPEGEVCRARVWLASAGEVERGGGTVVEIDW